MGAGGRSTGSAELGIQSERRGVIGTLDRGAHILGSLPVGSIQLVVPPRERDLNGLFRGATN